LPVPTAVGLLTIEMRARALRKARMVHDEPGLGALRVQLEFDDRVYPFWPVAYSPSLDDAPVGYKLDVSPRDDAAEAREGVAGVTIDLGWRTVARVSSPDL
jgi:hypothetical protein